MAKLLVSPTDELDALEAVKGGADIIDVKNPVEGSLGAAAPAMIRKIRQAVKKSIPVSAALGDVPNLPGTVAQAALGAAQAGADYVKIGLHGVDKEEDVAYILTTVVDTLRDFESKSKVVAALYGDYLRAGTLNPSVLPDIAQSAGVETVMIDTAIKDGRDLFIFMPEEEVASFVKKGQGSSLEVALAGSLASESFKTAAGLKPDIIGVRTAALPGGDRTGGRVDAELVKELKLILEDA
ncbi:MAG: (5-formylfuran-3-yl)methyl phosphate synthase [Candidatus Thorarchaeota archaeon]